MLQSTLYRNVLDSLAAIRWLHCPEFTLQFVNFLKWSNDPWSTLWGRRTRQCKVFSPCLKALISTQLWHDFTCQANPLIPDRGCSILLSRCCWKITLFLFPLMREISTDEGLLSNYPQDLGLFFFIFSLMMAFICLISLYFTLTVNSCQMPAQCLRSTSGLLCASFVLR